MCDTQLIRKENQTEDFRLRVAGVIHSVQLEGLSYDECPKCGECFYDKEDLAIYDRQVKKVRQAILENVKINCNNSEAQYYDCHTSIETPDFIKKYFGRDEDLCIDKCLTQEIKDLWNLGIITTGCCCGKHFNINNENLTSGFIGVATNNDAQKMKELGYIQIRESYNFIPKKFKSMTFGDTTFEYDKDLENRGSLDGLLRITSSKTTMTTNFRDVGEFFDMILNIKLGLS
jgi:hypothetical protein